MLAVTSATGPTAPAPAPAPTQPTPAEPVPPTKPDLEALRTQFTGLAGKLAAADKTIETMVTGGNPVGAGWSPHLAALSAELLAARDALLVAKPDTAADLGTKLGVDVRKLSEAAGSMSILARQRAALSQGWSTFLDASIADATAAADLLKPAPTDPSPVDPPKAEPTPKYALTAEVPAPAPASTPDTGPLPGDVDYCRTPDTIGRGHRF